MDKVDFSGKTNILLGDRETPTPLKTKYHILQWSLIHLVIGNHKHIERLNDNDNIGCISRHRDVGPPVDLPRDITTVGL